MSYQRRPGEGSREGAVLSRVRRTSRALKSASHSEEPVSRIVFPGNNKDSFNDAELSGHNALTVAKKHHKNNCYFMQMHQHIHQLVHV